VRHIFSQNVADALRQVKFADEHYHFGCVFLTFP